MFAFLLSPLGKIALYVAGALAAVGIIWGAIAYHDSQVKKEALYRYNQAQLQQTVKDQADQINRLGQINTTQQTVINDVNTKNDALVQKTDDISTYINNQTALSGDAAAPVLVETLKRLKELKD